MISMTGTKGETPLMMSERRCFDGIVLSSHEINRSFEMKSKQEMFEIPSSYKVESLYVMYDVSCEREVCFEMEGCSMRVLMYVNELCRLEWDCRSGRRNREDDSAGEYEVEDEDMLMVMYVE